MFLFFLAMFLLVLPALADQELFFTTHPCISPDGETIVFVYEGDLWQVNRRGGIASRLTGMEGAEVFPRFSPDGKWLAFSCTQDGNMNVYVMPVAGGDIRQLTYHSGVDIVDSWSWDSSTIYFNSNRYNNFTQFKVSVLGGTPARMFPNYFNTIHGLVAHPVTGDYYFTDSFESHFAYNRKRYKGAYNPEIKSFNPVTKKFNVLTQYSGKDFWPTIDSAGNLYFVSDEINGQYNLYTFKDGKKKNLTSFETSIKYPQVSAGGDIIVFEKDYQIYTYDVANCKSQKIPVKLARNFRLDDERDFNVTGKITRFSLSPDAKKIAFVSRGELFVSDIAGKFPRKLETSPTGRVVEIVWLKDSRTILFNQTVDGWLNIFKIAADGTGAEEQVTSGPSNHRSISLDRERSRALYVSGRTDLRVLELSTFTGRTVLSDELWGFRSSQPYFSPDGNFILYTVFRDFEQDVCIYDLKQKKSYNLTCSGVTETSPVWSPDGKYIFWASDPIKPNFPRGAGNIKIFSVPLQKYDDPFRSNNFASLFDQAAPKTSEEEPKVSVSIDYDNIMKRVQRISPEAGNQGAPHVAFDVKNKEYTIFYLSDHDGEPHNIWVTTLKEFTPPKTVKLKGAVARDLVIQTLNGKSYALVKGDIVELNPVAGSIKKIDIQLAFTRSLESEFRQMFDEVWANVEENFYDETFHGVDWANMKQRYSSFLPYIANRGNLRMLIGDMLGELNSSHLGFNSRGEEEKTFHEYKTVSTGILFEEDAPYTVKAIVRDSAADHSGIGIKPGDELFEVNGRAVDPSANREMYFTAPAPADEIQLTFRRGTGMVVPVKLHPHKNYMEFRGKLYDAWIDSNRNRVHELGGNRIGYVYMKNMGEPELERFMREMVTEGYQKEGLILDLRYNTGGNVHDAVLNFLSQKPYTLWKYRAGKFAPQPNFAPSGHPIVLLINAQTLSDAEMTAAGFKALKLGTIIGTETYRWVIFTDNERLVDGSVYRLPSWGCFTLDKKDIELYGVSPDIYIENTFLDRLEGKDPQLEKAVAHILEQSR